ncbi:hypothetical protein CF138_21395 [Aeromonas hydrophila]|nr:hypothetical protein CF138_21395 [Aeromonas hydrophila]
MIIRLILLAHIFIYTGDHGLMNFYLVFINKTHIFFELLIEFVVFKVDDLNWFATKSPQK